MGCALSTHRSPPASGGQGGVGLRQRHLSACDGIDGRLVEREGQQHLEGRKAPLIGTSCKRQVDTVASVTDRRCKMITLQQAGMRMATSPDLITILFYPPPSLPGRSRG